MVRRVLPLVGCLIVTGRGAEGSSAGEDALRLSGVTAGLCVHLGTMDGQLEGALVNGGRMLVQGLALSDEAAIRARRHLLEKGVYGLASVSRVADVMQLPYQDRTVNLLFADLDALTAAPAAGEMERVLGYEGVACLRKGGKLTRTVKPTPAGAL